MGLSSAVSFWPEKSGSSLETQRLRQGATGPVIRWSAGSRIDAGQGCASAAPVNNGSISIDGAGCDEHRLVGGYFAPASGIRLGQGTGREQARSYKTANPVGSGLRPRSSGLPGACNARWW